MNCTQMEDYGECNYSIARIVHIESWRFAIYLLYNFIIKPRVSLYPVINYHH